MLVGPLATVPPRDRYLSCVPSPTGKKVMSDAREVRLFINWNYFFLNSNVLSIWVPGHNSVPGNVPYVFYHNDGMLLHIFMEVNEFSLVPGHSVVLHYITLFIFSTMMAGYSISGFNPV